ncbi:MAG: hypothetical protein ACRDZ4_07755 [Egibacteraceae bacterium]
MSGPYAGSRPSRVRPRRRVPSRHALVGRLGGVGALALLIDQRPQPAQAPAGLQHPVARLGQLAGRHALGLLHLADQAALEVDLRTQPVL